MKTIVRGIDTSLKPVNVLNRVVYKKMSHGVLIRITVRLTLYLSAIQCENEGPNEKYFYLNLRPVKNAHETGISGPRTEAFLKAASF
jgi:hypothetical protein